MPIYLEYEMNIANIRKHEKDTGSIEVQIAQTTQRIKELTKHMQVHKKDKHSLRGLVGVITKRKKLMIYLKRTNLDMYKKLVTDLEIRDNV
tara:strand:- start:164 stop:436 length:273 start_codon:yes stop_codon:yes gene_type:complete